MALRTGKELEQGHFYSMKKSLLLLTMKPSILVGGQAVIEGVMMRVPGAYATAVRDPEGKIHIQKKDFNRLQNDPNCGINRSFAEWHLFLKL